MKQVYRITAALAIVALVAFSPKSTEVQSATASIDCMFGTYTTLDVIKDWGACYDLIECSGFTRSTATYTGTASFTVPNTYEVYYYDGGSCGRIITYAYQIPYCP